MATERRFYMPSEIARLVLGYLKSTNCQNSWKTFLTESGDLKEYFMCYQQGYEYPTEIGGKSLVQILNERNDSSSEMKNSTHDSQSSLIHDDIHKLQESFDLKFSKLSQSVEDISVKLASTARPMNLCKPVVNSTPVKNGNYTNITDSPRLTPRKNFTPRKRTLTSSLADLDFGDHLSDSAMEDVHIKPDVIVEELLNRPVLHEKLAENINRVFNCGTNAENLQEKQLTMDVGTTKETASDLVLETHLQDTVIDNNEVHFPDNAIHDILDLLEDDPEYSEILRKCAAKQDVFSDLYQTSYSSPICGSQSLSTPQSSHKFKSPMSTPVRHSSDMPVVKNLMNDLKTPQKDFTSSPKSSPVVNASPSKTSTDIHSLTPIVVPDFNFLTVSPSRLNPFSDTPQVAPKIICIPSTSTLMIPKTTVHQSIPQAQLSKPLSAPKASVRVSIEELKASNILKSHPKGKRFNSARLIADSKRNSNGQRKILPKPESSKTTQSLSSKISVIKGAESRSSLTNASEVQRFSVINNKVSRSLDFSPAVISLNNKSELVTIGNVISDPLNLKVDNEPAVKKLKEDDVVVLNSINIDEFLSKVHVKKSESNDNA